MSSNVVNRGSARFNLSRFGELGLLAVLAALFLVFTFSSKYFFTPKNLSNVLGQISITMISAVGLSLLVISGEVDLSIGSLQAVAALPLVLVMNATGSFWLGVVPALAVGVLIGVINGLLVTRLKINSLIVTLGMYYLLRGFVYLVPGKVPISDRSGKDLFFMVGNGKLFRFLPYMAILMIVILRGFHVRAAAHHLRAPAVRGRRQPGDRPGGGHQPRAAEAQRLHPVLPALYGQRHPPGLAPEPANHMAGQGFEFQVVAAIVLGGVSLAGGVGNLLGALIGVLIFGIVQNGLSLMNVGTQYQQVITGAIIILAVAVDELKKRHA